MNTRIAIAGLALCAGLGGAAHAGRKLAGPVTIDLLNHSASGALGTARNSADAKQAIGCSVHFDAVNQKSNANCTATDAAGATAQCATQQAELIQIALGINGDSMVMFSWDRSGGCTNIFVDNHSIHEPKH